MTNRYYDVPLQPRYNNVMGVDRFLGVVARLVLSDARVRCGAVRCGTLRGRSEDRRIAVVAARVAVSMR